jgi:hypothetical protein
MMRTLLAIGLGLLSGLMIFTMGGLLFVDVPNRTIADESLGLIAVLCVLTWAGTALGLRWRARSVLSVMRRAMWVGAIEWMLMIIPAMRLSGVILAELQERGMFYALDLASSQAMAFAAIYVGGFCIAGALFCLCAYALLRWLTRSEGDKPLPAPAAAQRIRCPKCGEVLKPDEYAAIHG